MNASTPYSEGTAGSRPAKSITRHLPTVARILMGLLFLLTGLNGFLNFIPPPKDPMPEAAMAFMDGLMKSGYMFQLISGTGLLVSVLLLLNRFVPLALALIAPVVVNIVAFHVFISPSGLGIALVVLALEAYLAWSYRSSYRPMLAARVTPG